ncbi:hypothetical protein JCM11491_002778 [Sporobolomyces phaffii]
MVKPEPTRTRRKPSQVSSDEEEAGEPDASEHSQKRVKLERHANGNGNKRARSHSDDGEADEDDDEDDDDEEEGFVPTGAAAAGEQSVLVRDSTGYVTGSIVRIACQAFLTYDHVEFRPGPALNMIIGPNGSGKSTIACAIAIGLGFSPKVLGRSNKIREYCKNNSNEECWIEIELKGKPREKNHVIRRTLSRDTDRTVFHLDGIQARASEVAERMEDLGIQVNNLCTFLPQDRVAAFAAMSPTEMLVETQKAAGDVNLSSWHQLLINEFKAQKEKQINVDTYTKKLNRSTSKQAEAEKEVQQFEQRKGFEQDLAVVDVLNKYAKYHSVFEQLQEIKTEKNVLDNEVKELEAKNKPFKDSKELLQMIAQNSQEAYQALEKKIRKATVAAAKKEEQVKKNTNDATELADELKGIRRAEKEREESIKNTRRKIEKLTPLVENEPEEKDTSEIDRKIADKARERSSKEEQIGELKAELGQLGRSVDELDRNRQAKLDTINNMKQVHVVRETALQKFDPHCWQAVQWLRQNRGMFRGQVFEPPRLTIFPKEEFKGNRFNFRRDTHLLEMIEGPISKDAFRTFGFEFRDDYDKFMHELADKQGLKLAGAEVGSSGEIKRQISDAQLEELGFDALACDLLTGPPPVIAWLANEHNLARTPLQLYKRPLADQKISRLRAINRYYTCEGSVQIRVSNYGNRNAMTESRALANAKFLSSGVDEEKVRQLETEVEGLAASATELRQKCEKFKKIGRETTEQVKALQQEREELKAEKEQMSALRRKYMKNRVDLAALEKTLERELAYQEKNSGQKKRDEIAREMKRVLQKRVKLALEFKDHVLENAQLQHAAIKLHLQALQADSDHRAMELVVRERDEEFETKSRQLEQLKKELKQMITEGKQLMVDAETAIENSTDEVKERVHERRRQGLPRLDELDVERDGIKAKLQCMISISPAVLEAYEKRKSEITELTANLEEATEDLNESKKLIEETRAKWLPKLETLVADVSKNFTRAFDTFGLLGEVRLAQDEDYEKWAIEIMVSFRDQANDARDVSLHVLSGTRQSGGERALSTATYVIALAELARAPFSLVDEINQGMDQRAERNMHKMLVETACSGDVGQYFLLTPKVLPDLAYHERMKVLIVNSGSFVPEGLSLQAMVKRRKQLNVEHRRLGRIQIEV